MMISLMTVAETKEEFKNVRGIISLMKCTKYLDSDGITGHLLEIRAKKKPQTNINLRIIDLCFTLLRVFQLHPKTPRVLYAAQTP